MQAITADARGLGFAQPRFDAGKMRSVHIDGHLQAVIEFAKIGICSEITPVDLGIEGCRANAELVEDVDDNDLGGDRKFPQPAIGH